MRISDWSSDVCSSDLPKKMIGACRGGQADHLFWVHRGARDRRHFAAAFGGGGAINLVGIGCLIDGGAIGASVRGAIRVNGCGPHFVSPSGPDVRSTRLDAVPVCGSCATTSKTEQSRLGKE